MFIVEDLSGSFGDDVVTVRGLLDNLTTQIRALQPDSRFGAGSFVDKPVIPFGDPAFGDYVYRTDAKISADVTAVKSAFDNMVVLNGYDWYESQLEALYQVALRTVKDDSTSSTTTDEIGFRPGSMRFVVLATDAPYHTAGDYAGTGPNDGDTVLDGTPPGTGEDFPSVAQVKEALLKANIYPIFAVTSGNETTYQDLATQLGRGDVVNLSGDSSNLVNSIKTGLSSYRVDFVENLVGTNLADTLTGNGLNNSIEGGGGADILQGGMGNDVLYGGEGRDLAVFSGDYSEYRIDDRGAYTLVSDLVSNRDGVDSVYAEVLRFKDQDVSLSGQLIQNDFSLSFDVKGTSLWGLGGLSPLKGSFDIFNTSILEDKHFNMTSGPGESGDWNYINLISRLDINKVDLSMPVTWNLDAGSFNVLYKVDLKTLTPESVGYGEAVVVKTTAPTEEKVSLEVAAPKASASLGLKLGVDIDGQMRLEGDIVGLDPFNIQLAGFDTKDSYQLDFLNLDLSGDIWKSKVDFGALYKAYENVNERYYSKSEKEIVAKVDKFAELAAEIKVEGGKTDEFVLDSTDNLDNALTTLSVGSLQAKLDLDDLAGLFWKPMALLDGSLEKNYFDDKLKVELEAKGLGLDLIAKASFVTDFTFDPDRIDIVATANGINYTAELGKDLFIGTGGLTGDIMDISTEYHLHGKLVAAPGVKFSIDAEIKALGAKADISYNNYHLANIATDWDSSDGVKTNALEVSKSLLAKTIYLSEYVDGVNWEVPVDLIVSGGVISVDLI